MPSANRTIRLFVSSTFSDFKAERDLLQRAVFPKLRQICLSKGLRFQAIDLRWGVSEEAGKHNRTMLICLRELRRCQQSRIKPNFLVLLGDRYGSKPLPPVVPADLFEAMCPFIETQGAQAAAALQWYRRDDNAVPPAYVLQPRTGEMAENRKRWAAEVEVPLLAAFGQAASQCVATGVFSPEQRAALQSLHIGLAATHQEIVRGALSLDDPRRQHVHAFVRTIRYAAGERAHRDFVDLGPDGTPDPHARTQLSQLRCDLEAKLGQVDDHDSNLHGYTVEWRDSGQFSDADLAEFEQSVLAALTSAVEQQAQSLDSIPPEEQEETAHAEFGAERREGFAGRQEALNRVAAYLMTGTGRPLAVVGPAGSGKSAFMAQASQVAGIRLQVSGGTESQESDRQNGPVIVERYIGATPASGDIISLLRDIVGCIRRAYPRRTTSKEDESPSPGQRTDGPPNDAEIPVDLNPLVNAFHEALTRPTADRPLFLFIDALDQLGSANNAHQLNWLPANLSEHARVVVSTASPSVGGTGVLPADSEASTDHLFAALASRIPAGDRIVLDPLTRKDGDQMLGHWLAKAHRALQPAQRDAVLKAFALEGNPLWLRTAANEFARYAHWQNLPGFPSDTAGLMRHILRRLSVKEEHGDVLVNRALGYLACARHGLAEDEILDVLSADEDVMANFRQRHPKSPPVAFLPVAVWVAFRGDIEGYLAEHDAQQALLMRFYHRSFREAVETEFLAERALRKDRHAHLAAVYSRQPWTLPATTDAEPTLSDPPNARKTSELPWHQFQAAENADPDHRQMDVWDPVAATLCDMRFVEATCRSGQVWELQTDYKLVHEALPEAQEELAEERRRQERNDRWTTEIIAYAKAWSERRDRCGRGEAVTEPEPTLPEPVPTCEMWTEERIQAECERIIGKPTRRDRLEAFAGFVNGQCHPLLEHGRRPGFVLQHSFGHARSGPVHGAAEALLSLCKVPILLRRWPPNASYNPKSALLRTLTGHTGHVLCVSVTADGRRAVSGSADHTLRAWDLESGACLQTLEGHRESVQSVSVTPDGRYAVSGGSSPDSTVRVWDLESGQCLRKLEGHNGSVLSVDLTPDGRCAVSGSADRTLRVWDLDSGICLHTLKGHGFWVTGVSVTPDGRRALSGGNSSPSLLMWDLESGTCLRTLEEARDGISSMRVTPDGRRLVVADDSIALLVLDLGTGCCVRTLRGHGNLIRSIDITKDGLRAVSGSEDRTLRVWDLESGASLCMLEGHSGLVSSVSVTPDGRRVVSGSWDETVRVWDIQKSACRRSIEVYEARVTCVSVAQDGRRVVTVNGKGRPPPPRVWDAERGMCLCVLQDITSDVSAISVTPDGRFVVLAGGKWGHNSVGVYELETGKSLRMLGGHTRDVTSVSVTQDGRRVASGSLDNTVRVWDLESGACLRTLKGHRDWVNSVTVTQDGQRIVSVSRDSALRVWDLESGRCLHTLRDESGRVGSVSVTPDGRCAVASGFWTILRVWDLESGACLRSLDGHTAQVKGVNVTPDGCRAISWSGDRTLRVWDLETGTCLRVLAGHTGEVERVSVMEDGRRAVSGSEDRTLRVWDLISGQCSGVFHAAAPVSAVALFAGRLVVGLHTGEVLFAEMRNTPIGVVILTATSSQQARCPVCGQEFAPPPDIVRAIRAVDASGLLSHCPHCQQSIQFHPFFSAADDYADVLRRGLEFSRREKGTDHEETLAHLTALAVHLEKMGKHDEARAFAKERDEIAARMGRV